MQIRIRDRVLWGLVIGGGVLDRVLEGGCRAYHRDKLYSWTPVGYSKKKYRDLIGRLYREGYVQRVLIDRQVHYRITGAGRRKLVSLYPVLGLTRKKWDGFWRIVIFDVPEKRRRSRDVLRNKLKKMGFGRLQNSTYISPYDQGKALINFLQVRGLMGRALLLESKQKHLGNPKNLAEKVWSLEETAKGYRRVIDRLGTRFGIKEARKRKEFLKRVYQEYLQVLLEDQFLPVELLPSDWPAEKARKYVLRAGVVRD